MTYHKRNLPHYHPEWETLFVTFRTVDSLPQEVLRNWKEEQDTENRKIALEPYANRSQKKAALYNSQKRAFGKFDALLDNSFAGQLRLNKPEIATEVADALQWQHRHNNFNLFCYCIMPNHVHFVAQLSDDLQPFNSIMKSIKNYSARQINKLLNLQGHFWQREYYDHVVRDGKEFERIISYVLENPVKAGLVDDWQQWPYTYLAPELQ